MKAPSFDSHEFKLVRRDLAAVLDRHPDARSVMRFVQALERSLRKKGRHALEELPLKVLRRAMSQLDAVVVDWSPEGLRLLRSKAALSIAEREYVGEHVANITNRRSIPARDFYDEVEVEEASVTIFMEASEEWERSFTGRTETDPIEPSNERAEVHPA